MAVNVLEQALTQKVILQIMKDIFFFFFFLVEKEKVLLLRRPATWEDGGLVSSDHL